MRLIDVPKEIFKLPILEQWLAKKTYKKSTTDWVARIAPLYQNYRKNSMRNAVRNEIAYELDISDYMEWLVYYGIDAEPKESLYSLIRANDVVLDIGANIGEVTLNAAKIVGPLGAVHAFEPDPFIFSKLRKNVDLNIFKNIALNNFAIGEKQTHLLLAAQIENNRGGTRIVHNSAKANRVKVSTVDDYVKEQKLSKIDLVKIDVEGFEMKVLLGSQSVLKEFKPSLFIELNDKNLRDQNDTANGLIEFLLLAGYKKIVDANNGTPVLPSNNFANNHCDIIAS